MTLLIDLKNLGPTIIRRLNEIGIYSKDELRQVGAVSAYKLICERHPGKTIPVCYYLYSVEGALRGVHWNKLSKRTKEKLLDQVARPDNGEQS